MKVRQLMSRDPAVCSPGDHLATAAMKMWHHDCGIVPIVDDATRGVVGVITDRDVAMALALKGRRAHEVGVFEVASGEVRSCGPDDEATVALATMREHCLRRLPVLEGGKLVGMLSLNDLALAAREAAGEDGRPTYASIAEALQTICEHRSALVATG